MQANPLHIQIGNLKEYALGHHPDSVRTNVPMLGPRNRVGAEKAIHLSRNPFAWHLAQQLEGREQSPEGGVWPISFFRCERRFGNPGTDVFPPLTPLSAATKRVYREAFNFRLPCYHRVANSVEAKQAFRALRPQIRYATEVTYDWYDPLNGNVPAPGPHTEIVGSHGVPLERIESSAGKERFVFQNSWGAYWGDNGWGSIPIENFDRFIIEAWDPHHNGFRIPYRAKSGTTCLEWMWSVDPFTGIHVREIVDAATGEYLAWAFCRRRGDYLDVEEFFVWPSERRKGYARQLVRMIRQLAKSMGAPIRLLVSYADTESQNLSNLDAAANLFEVKLSESGERWVHLFGTASPTISCAIRERPARPENPLEYLRRDGEPANTDPIEHFVFFATNRKPLNANDAGQGFGGERDTTLHLGSTPVKVPVTPALGPYGRFWMQIWSRIWRKNARLNKPLFFSNGEDFRTMIVATQGNFEQEPRNLLYVHGFNTTFQEAVAQAGRFGAELRLPGSTFCFSWPSGGAVSQYFADEAAVDANVHYLRSYILTLLRETGNQRLSILAHSMGNRVVIRCLEAMAQNDSHIIAGRIDQLILAAPDVDSEVFNQASRNFLSIPSRTTLYMSRGDIPLFISSLIHNYGRAGLAPSLITQQHLDTVLVEGFNLSDYGHDYYATADRVHTDLFMLLHYGAAPERRPRLEKKLTSRGETYWRLPLKPT